MNYVIKSIRKSDGTPHEREARRKGHRVNIMSCRVGESMIYGEGELVIWTQNTEYTFVKEVSAPASE